MTAPRSDLVPYGESRRAVIWFLYWSTLRRSQRIRLELLRLACRVDETAEQMHRFHVAHKARYELFDLLLMKRERTRQERQTT